MTEEQRSERREIGWLILTIPLSMLAGLIAGLYSAYYWEWVKSAYPNSNWGFILIFSSIALIVIMAFLFVYAFSIIRRNRP